MVDAGDGREAERLRRVYAEYDRAHRGSTAWNAQNAGNRAIVAERRRLAGDLLRGHGLGPGSGAAVLEIGCGVGDFLADLLTLGFQAGELHAIDLLESNVASTRERYPELDIRCANAERLPSEDGAFRVVVMATVLSSILDPQMAGRVAAEASRVLAPGGAILWYDMRYDNPSNRNVRGVKRDELERLFPGFRIELRPLTVLPLLARRLGRSTRRLYPLLAMARPLRTHLIGLLRKPSA